MVSRIFLALIARGLSIALIMLRYRSALNVSVLENWSSGLPRLFIILRVFSVNEVLLTLVALKFAHYFIIFLALFGEGLMNVTLVSLLIAALLSLITHFLKQLWSISKGGCTIAPVRKKGLLESHFAIIHTAQKRILVVLLYFDKLRTTLRF